MLYELRQTLHLKPTDALKEHHRRLHTPGHCEYLVYFNESERNNLLEYNGNTFKQKFCIKTRLQKLPQSSFKSS